MKCSQPQMSIFEATFLRNGMMMGDGIRSYMPSRIGIYIPDTSLPSPYPIRMKILYHRIYPDKTRIPLNFPRNFPDKIECIVAIVVCGLERGIASKYPVEW